MIDFALQQELDYLRIKALRDNSFKPRTFEMTEAELMECPIRYTYLEFLPAKS